MIYSVLPSSSELRASDGCGNGHVEGFARLCTFGPVGDEQFVRHGFGGGWRDAVSFVAHDDDAMVGERKGIDIVAL